MSVTRFGDGVPLNAKGQIVTHDGTTAISIPVGSDGQILTAQSSTSSGLLWANVNTGETQYVTLIASTTITSATHSITFSNIPQTYDELLLVMSSKRGDTQTLTESGIRINSNSNTVYGFAYYNYGVGGNSSNISTEFKYYLGGPYKSMYEISFPAYTSSDSKVIFYRGTTINELIATSANSLGHGVWNNTDAITSITIYAGLADETTRTFYDTPSADYYWILYGVDWS